MRRFPRAEIAFALAAAAVGVAVYAAHPLSGAGSPVRYRDVAGASSFRYVTRNDYRNVKYFIQPICGGVVIFDYDGDGTPDIYFSNGAELPSLRKGPEFEHCLLHGTGGGRYEDRTAAAGLSGAGAGYSFGAAAGDYDNDGFPDLFLCNAGRNTLYHNNGDGTFTDVTDASGIARDYSNAAPSTDRCSAHPAPASRRYSRQPPGREVRRYRSPPRPRRC